MAVAQALNRARDGSKWQRTSPRSDPKPYTAPRPTSLLFAVALAVHLKSMAAPLMYRGRQPVYLGARARARAAGFMNVKHQQRVERERAAQQSTEIVQ